MSGLLTRVLTELWAFSVDTFADGEIKVMTDTEATVMMNRILGKESN